MTPFLFRCPVTGQNVQGWSADDAAAAADQSTAETVRCLACRQLHWVVPRTGAVVGNPEE